MGNAGLSIAGGLASRSAAIDASATNPGQSVTIGISATGSVLSLLDSGISATALLPRYAGFNLTNAGQISGTNGAFLYADTVRIMNSGLISGSTADALTISASGAKEIQNTGTLMGITGVYSEGGGTDLVLNSGLISGTVTALDLDDSRTTVVNAGTIVGLVLLNSGDDQFDGTAGRQGRVSGGIGNDYLRGGAFDDFLDGGDNNDLLTGGGGDDLLYGGLGRDRMFGNAGADEIIGGSLGAVSYGGAGEDTLRGDEGADLLYGGSEDDTITGGVEADSLWGGDGHDALYGGDAADAIWGGQGDDDATGGFGNDVFRTGQGDDTVSGEFNNDTIFGGAGDDLLRGQAGADRLIGGAGDDTLSGGDLRDTFVFTRGHGNDIIADFAVGDVLDLTGFAFGARADVYARVQVQTAGMLFDLTDIGGGTILLSQFTIALDDTDFLI